MSTLYDSVHAPAKQPERSAVSAAEGEPKQPKANSYPKGRERIEFATDDADLRRRLSTSTWLSGRRYTFPAWLNDVSEVVGHPSRIAEIRVDRLRDGRLPCNSDERRYIRNKAAIKHISAQLSKQVEAERVNSATVAAKSVTLATATSIDSHRQCLDASNALSAKTSSSVMPSISAPTDAEEAERLKRTVLAPFYQRMQEDSDVISRLQEEKAQLSIEIRQSKNALAKLLHETDYVPAAVDSGEDNTRLHRPIIKRIAPSYPFTKPTKEPNNDYDKTLVGRLFSLSDMIGQELDAIVLNETIHLCGLMPIKLMDDNPDAVLQLARDKLHTWPYQNVPTCWRRLYEDATLSKAAHMLRSQAVAVSEACQIKKRKVNGERKPAHNPQTRQVSDSDWMANLVEVLDKGLTMSGAPGRSSIFEAVFLQLQEFVEIDLTEKVPDHFYLDRPKPLATFQPIARSPLSLSLEDFQNHLDAATTPLIISGALSHWPASRKWTNPRYFLQVTLGGRRMVPVEVGKSYTDEEWSQSMMTFGHYMTNYVLPAAPKEIGYLAQHDLFAQIPALRKDIAIPDYCYANPPGADAATLRTAGLASVSQLTEPLLNAWIGPKGTTTPLHTDPYHNILCQVVGYKYVRLYSPQQTPNLYPLGMDEKGVKMENTSSVDVSCFRNRSLGGTADFDAIRQLRKKYPRFPEAEFVESILSPGECLYIPLGWWHYVESLSVSCSVSFWWN